jgi:hypothetical protein
VSSERSTVRVVRDGLRLLRDVWRIRHWSATGAYESPEHPLRRRTPISARTPHN